MIEWPTVTHLTPKPEVRWFVPGDVPVDRSSTKPASTRIDEYAFDELACDRSLKRRGGRRLEWKIRTGRVEMVQFDGIVGFAESWVKRRDLPVEPPSHTRWLRVRKRVWTRDDLQVTALEVAGERWWSVAMTPTSAPRLLRPWADALGAHGESCSYPEWLLALARRRLLVSAA